MSDCTVKPALKSCPFCGGEAEMKYSEWTDSCDPPERHHVWSVGCAKKATREYCCPGRLCMNRGYKNRDEAIEAWNARAERTCTMEELIRDFVKFVRPMSINAWSMNTSPNNVASQLIERAKELGIEVVS